MNMGLDAYEVSAGNGATYLIKGPFAGQKFKFHFTDPRTGKREIKEIGG